MKSACVSGLAPSQASCPGSLRCIHATGFLPEPHLRERHKLQERAAKEQNGFLSKLLHVLPKGGVALGPQWDRHGRVPGGAGNRVHCVSYVGQSGPSQSDLCKRGYGQPRVSPCPPRLVCH